MFEKEYTVSSFYKLANKILNNTIIHVKGKEFRICEIEMYMKNSSHQDHYVHCHKDQKSFEHFYFHKYKNGTYKSGTYKGVDIAIGNDKTYFGILIRSIQDMDTGLFTEGSCNCVNKLISFLDVTTVKELFDTHFPNTEQLSVNNAIFGLKDKSISEEIVYQGPRIGLSDKYPEYRDLLYRYATNIQKIKKKRKTFVKAFPLESGE